MSKFDFFTVLHVFLTALDHFPLIPERTVQSFVNKAVMLRLIRSGLGASDALTVGGQQLVSSTTPANYMGNSQGAILGGAYLAFNPELQAGVLGESGTNYGLLLSRSVDFNEYWSVLKLQLWSGHSARIMLSVMQTAWDQGEGAGWLRQMGNKAVLLQCAFGDAQVTRLSCHIQARAFGAVFVAPQNEVVWGVPEQTAPFPAKSVLVEYKYDDVPLIPFANVAPAEATDTHECVVREARAQRQLAAFLDGGVVEQYCVGGPCSSPTCPYRPGEN